MAIAVAIRTAFFLASASARTSVSPHLARDRDFPLRNKIMFFREIQTLVNVTFLITVRFALESHAPAGPLLRPYRAGDFHFLLVHQPVRFRERNAGIVIYRVIAIRFALFF